MNNLRKRLLPFLALSFFFSASCSVGGNLTSQSDIPTLDPSTPTSLYDYGNAELKSVVFDLVTNGSGMNSEEWGYYHVRNFVTDSKYALHIADQFLGIARTNWSLFNATLGVTVTAKDGHWFNFNKTNNATNSYVLWAGRTSGETNIFATWTRVAAGKFTGMVIHWTPSTEVNVKTVTVLFDNTGTEPTTELYTVYKPAAWRVAGHFRQTILSVSPLAIQLQALVTNNISYPRSFDCVGYAVEGGTNGIWATGYGIETNKRLTNTVTYNLTYREYFDDYPILDGPVYFYFNATPVTADTGITVTLIGGNTTNATEPADISNQIAGISHLTTYYYQ
jgi:hypothetical protein